MPDSETRLPPLNCDEKIISQPAPTAPNRNDGSPVGLWEILVPTVRNCGTPIRTRFHRQWDKIVRGITGGLTVMPPNVKGEWISPTGELFAERMIPVRVIATVRQMREIATVTRKYYGQEAIMYYRISDYVRIHEESNDVQHV